jgi:hypothetical protein
MARTKRAPAEGVIDIASAKPKAGRTSVIISAPRLRTAEFELVGTAPYVQLRFTQKAMEQMKAKMEGGSQSKSKKIRDKRDFNDDFIQAQHISTEGWNGVPAGAFRTAMIDACRLVDFKMTLAKLSVFIEADGIDKVDGVPLVKLIGKKPEQNLMAVRNQTGVADLRNRPMWREWRIKLRVKWDEDQFSLQDVTNLLARVGEQVGIGEGRHYSKASAGLGWGTFRIAGSKG